MPASIRQSYWLGTTPPERASSALLATVHGPARRVQPADPVPVDWTNPITRGLEFAILPGFLADSAGRLGLMTLGAGSTRRGGTLIQPGTSRNNGVIVRSGALLGPMQNSTIIAVASTTAATGTANLETDGQIGTNGDALYAESGSPSNLYKLCATNAGGLGVEFTYRNDANVLLQQRVYDASLNDGRPKFLAARKNGTSHSAVIGRLVSAGTFGSASSAFTNANNQIRIGSDQQDIAASFNGQIYLVAGWSRALTDQELAYLNDNPWQLFTARANPIMVAA